MKQKGVISLISEPTLVEDFGGLISQYTKLRRFKCDHENCTRILRAYESKPFRCTSCGQGTMFPESPKGYCCECGEPIYQNVSKDCDVVRDKCVAQKVAKVEELKKKVGKDILRLRSKSRKRTNGKKKDEPLGIIGNKKDYNLALSLLKEKREKEDEIKEAAN